MFNREWFLSNLKILSSSWKRGRKSYILCLFVKGWRKRLRAWLKMASACPNNVHKVELISISLSFPPKASALSSLRKENLTWPRLVNLFSDACSSKPGDMINCLWWLFFYSTRRFMCTWKLFLSSISIFCTAQRSIVEKEDFANANSEFARREQKGNLFSMKTAAALQRSECFMVNLLYFSMDGQGSDCICMGKGFFSRSSFAKQCILIGFREEGKKKRIPENDLKQSCFEYDLEAYEVKSFSSPSWYFKDCNSNQKLLQIVAL